MFKTARRLFFPNPFEQMLEKCAKKKGKKILLCWNRGLGDIALGLFAMVQRIKEVISDAEITFLIREGLAEGFSLLPGVEVRIQPNWKRGEKISFDLNRKEFDLVIESPDPTQWVKWQLGKVVPKLQWDEMHDPLHQRFSLSGEYTYIGVQMLAETNYGLWRNWSKNRWEELFTRLENLEDFRVLLFGHEKTDLTLHPNVIDLRGKTTLFELLSIIKNKCQFLLLPDSGILSMVYYLNTSFPIHVLSLWADSHHGILKQNVASPNPRLVHIPLISPKKDLNQITVNHVLSHIVPLKSLNLCPFYTDIECRPVQNTAVVILAGGQGTRLRCKGPKGCFTIQGKSLFQCICDKVTDANIPIAIMTSPLNHEETVSFFQKNQNFGKKISFFQQSMGEYGPDGNGSFFKAFVLRGLDRMFEENHIDTVSVVPIDNILAHPLDAALLSYHNLCHHDVTVQCVPRVNPQESMGVLVERKGHLEILEYLDLNPEENYKYNYTGAMVMSLALIRKIANIELPFHAVHKKIRFQWVWKQERFIFDGLPFAKRAGALCYPRELCFAPLKSLDQLEGIYHRVLS